MNNQERINQLVSALNEELYDESITQFTNGEHNVEWTNWYDSENETSYDSWVCTTHNQLYYRVCVYENAQID